MIIRITGKVKFPITLDASVWIFDERKLLFEEAFSQKKTKQSNKNNTSLKEAGERLSRAYREDPRTRHINPGMNKEEREAALKNSYLMPIKQFIKNAQPEERARKATLVTKEGKVEIQLEELENSLLFFADKGKPLANKGPVHLYFKDGSNRDQPIKGINEISIH